MTLEARELSKWDRAILDYLQEDSDDDGPWGFATPIVVKSALEDQGYEDVPTRQHLNNRMQTLAAGNHLENVYGKGMYKFVSDPRNN